MEEKDIHNAGVAESQEQLNAKCVDLSRLSAKHSELTDELIHVKLQTAAGAIVLDDQKLVASSFERLSKRARVARQCGEASTTSWSAAFSALLE